MKERNSLGEQVTMESLNKLIINVKFIFLTHSYHMRHENE